MRGVNSTGSHGHPGYPAEYVRMYLLSGTSLVVELGLYSQI